MKKSNVILIVTICILCSCKSSTKKEYRVQNATDVEIRIETTDGKSYTVLESGSGACASTDGNSIFIPPLADKDSVVFVYEGNRYLEISKTGHSYLNLDCYEFIDNERDEAFSKSYPVYVFLLTEDYIMSLPEVEPAE
jgi:hypothetical protein